MHFPLGSITARSSVFTAQENSISKGNNIIRKYKTEMNHFLPDTRVGGYCLKGLKAKLYLIQCQLHGL